MNGNRQQPPAEWLTDTGPNAGDEWESACRVTSWYTDSGSSRAEPDCTSYQITSGPPSPPVSHHTDSPKSIKQIIGKAPLLTPRPPSKPGSLTHNPPQTSRYHHQKTALALCLALSAGLSCGDEAGLTPKQSSVFSASAPGGVLLLLLSSTNHDADSFLLSARAHEKGSAEMSNPARQDGPDALNKK